MAKKDPVRGAEPMDDYLSSIADTPRSKKIIDALGGASLAAVGSIPIVGAKRSHDLIKERERKESNKAALENQKEYGMKKGGKVKKYADGGMTQQPTYPFYGNQPQAGGQNGGMNQTFNMQPQANADANQQPQQRFKKGGKVSSASSRADGCAIRGKTRA
jgi:hypothetical protein